MFFTILSLLFSLCGTNSNLKQLKYSANLLNFLEETSKDVVCPEHTEQFKEIADGNEATGNSYACNQIFRNPISITGLLLQIYHCRFSSFKSTPISINSVSGEGSIFISNCNFIKCKQGCISLNAVNLDPTKLKISYCRFTLCTSASDKYVIYFNSNSGTIEHFYFHNNYGTPLSDILYKPTSTAVENDQLIIDNCVFEQSQTKIEYPYKCNNFLSLEDNSKITFTNNNISIWTDGKVFAKELNNPNAHTFTNNYMYPFNASIIGSSLPEGSIVDPDDKLDCPAPNEGVPIAPNYNYCGNIANPSVGTTILTSNSFVQVYHSYFNSIKNFNSNGGAVFLSIPDQPSIDKSNSIKFYHSVFINCAASKGCAIYVESDDQNRLFDFYKCTFEYNNIYEANKGFSIAGGGIYIESSVSCFRFSETLFSKNYAIDGGAIYYTTKESSTKDRLDENSFVLQIDSCYFFDNIMYNTGGSLSINIKGTELPRPIDIRSCTFISNHPYEDDAYNKDDVESGGAIYYSLASQSSDLSTEQIDSIFTVSECIFIENSAFNYGGAIYITVSNNLRITSIEIIKCSFEKNHANTDGLLGYGGSIYCLLSDITESSENENPSLIIHDCNFSNSFSFAEGGSIAILIKNSQSLKPIEIYNCSFENNDDIFFFDTPITLCGTFIAQTFESSDSSFINKSPLHINNCSFIHNADVYRDSYDDFEYQGGCIYLSSTNCQETGPIEINYCTFYHKLQQRENIHSIGGSICYISNTASQSSNNYIALSISNCQFSDSETRKYGGSIYLSLTDDDSQKQIDITSCTFKNTKSVENKDAIYIQSNRKTNNVTLTDCTFESCMILFNALTTSIEKCIFNEVNENDHAIVYKSAYSEDLETSFSINNCNFVQTSSKVNSLVHFETKLSSKFSFTNNIIDFTGLDSHVLGCKAELEIQEGE